MNLETIKNICIEEKTLQTLFLFNKLVTALISSGVNLVDSYSD